MWTKTVGKHLILNHHEFSVCAIACILCVFRIINFFQWISYECALSKGEKNGQLFTETPSSEIDISQGMLCHKIEVIMCNNNLPKGKLSLPSNTMLLYLPTFLNPQVWELCGEAGGLVQVSWTARKTTHGSKFHTPDNVLVVSYTTHMDGNYMTLNPNACFCVCVYRSNKRTSSAADRPSPGGGSTVLRWPTCWVASYSGNGAKDHWTHRVQKGTWKVLPLSASEHPSRVAAMEHMGVGTLHPHLGVHQGHKPLPESH